MSVRIVELNDHPKNEQMTKIACARLSSHLNNALAVKVNTFLLPHRNLLETCSNIILWCKEQSSKEKHSDYQPSALTVRLFSRQQPIFVHTVVLD